MFGAKKEKGYTPFAPATSFKAASRALPRRQANPELPLSRWPLHDNPTAEQFSLLPFRAIPDQTGQETPWNRRL